MRRSRQAAIDELGRAMQRYQRSVQAFDDAVGRMLDLGPADLRCLDWLTGGPMTAGQLTVATGLRPAATTALIDRLEARGLVQRVRSENDRRQVLVEMTSEGHARTWEAYGALVEEGQSLLQKFTIAELDQMRDHLDAIRELTDRHRERITKPHR
ncbi:MAG: MarR family winged helix-turn-helix transcriptional regulator [Streptosporangiales bacterium]